MNKWIKKIDHLSRTHRLVFYAFILIAFTPLALFLAKNPLKVRADSFLKFDEGYGTTTKDAQNNTSGTITNAIWKSEEFCIAGKCLFFDGSGDFVSFGDDNDFDFAAATNWTISLWFRHAPKTSGTDILVAKTNSSAGYKILMESDGDITFAIDDDATWTPDDSATSTAATYDDNQWHHVAAVKTGTTKIELFIDGQLVATDSSLGATATLVNSANLYVGIDGDGTSNPFTGFIDEVNIYTTTARTAITVKNDAIKGASEAGSSAVFGQSDPLSNGLVGYWKMDEASWTNNCSTGSVLDSSGNGNDGDACPNTTGPTGGAAGKFGNGGVFDGTDDYISVADNDSLSFSNNTMSAGVWIKRSGNPAANEYVITKGASGNWEYSLYVATNGTFGITLWTSSGSTIVNETSSSNAIFTDGNWHHIAFTSDGSELRLYYDGKPDDVDPVFTGTMSNAGSTMYVGDRPDQTDAEFQGSLDELRLYNRTLSPTEVAKLYNQAPGPIGHWKLDENAGQVVNSLVGSGGTLGIDASAGNDDPSWITGKYGSGLYFDGSTDLVRNADDDSFSFGDSTNDQTFTFSAWVNPTDGTDREIISKYTEYVIRFGSDGRLICSQDDASTGGLIGRSWTGPVDTNTWYHIACTYDGSKTSAGTKIYLNGIRVDDADETSGSYTAMENTANSLRFGDTLYTGSLDDVRLYNYERTPEQIVQDMNDGNSNSGSNSNSPILHLKFDEGYGDTAHDSSQNQIHGDLAGSGGSCPGAANCPTQYSAGKINKALDFDGTNDYVAIVDNSIFDVLDSDDLVVSGWFNRDTSGTEDTIIAKRNSLASPDVGWIVSVRDTNVFDFQLSDGTDEYQMTTTQTFTTPGWNFFTIVWDQDSTSNSKIFINGMQMPITTSGTIGNVGDTSNALDLRIGTHSDGSDRFDGKIDDIKVFKTTLTDSQILSLFNQGATTTIGSTSTTSTGQSDNSSSRDYCPPGNAETNCGSGDPTPVGHWKMDENTGATANDSSGNGYSGTVNNATTLWSQCKLGSCITSINSNGTDEYTSIADTSALDFSNAQSFTYSAWVKHIAKENANYFFIYKGSETSSSPGYNMENTSGNKFACSYSDGDGSGMETATSTTTVDSNFHHVSCVMDRTGATGTIGLHIFVDGKLEGSDTSLTEGSGAGSTQNLVFGETDTGYEAGMAVDDIKVYNYARTPTQIAWDMNKGAPIAWYKFDECTGSTTYNSALNGSGLTAGMNASITIGASGTYTSTGSCSSGTSTHSWNAGTTGKYGSAFAVDATNDYASVSDTDNLDFSTAMTVAGWIYTDTLPSASVKDAQIVNKFLTATNQRSFKLIVDKADNKYYFLVDGDGVSGATVSVASDILLTTGTWHHVVGVFQNSTGYLYVDGKLQSNTSTQGFTSVFNSTADMVIGMDANKTSAPNAGKYDDIMVFNYPLTQSQITTLFNQGSALRL